MNDARIWLAAGMLIGCCGCGNEVIQVPAEGQAQVSAPAPPPPAPPAAATAAAPAGANALTPPGVVATKPQRLPDVPPVLAGDPDEKGPDALGPDGPPANREEAQAGVGAKGRGYGGGVYTEPLHQKFTIQQRLVFSVQIPEAMKLYKAEHNNRAPQSHEAFMKDIIEANSIGLPELPEGDKYIYDPKLEKLLVQHPE